MVLSGPREVLLEVEHDSVITRWLSSALVPPWEHPATLDVSGEAVIAEANRKTRSNDFSFSTGSKVEGQVCVCEAFDKRSANEAALFAVTAGARLLLVTHEPTLAVTIPTIVISRGQFEHVNGRPAAMISAVQISRAHKAIATTLRIGRTSAGVDQSLLWECELFVPTSLIENIRTKLDFRYMVDMAPTVFRDSHQSIVSADGRFSGKICLFDAIHPGDFKQAVALATEHGASALIICCKDPPDWSGLTLPVITINRDRLEALKRAGLRAGDLGVTISYEEDAIPVEDASSSLHGRPVDSLSPEQWPPLPRESQQNRNEDGAPVDGNNVQRNLDHSSLMPSKSHRDRKDPPESKGTHGWMASFVEKASNRVKDVFRGYTLKSKEEFGMIVRNGISWSYDRPDYVSFHNALLILDRIKGIQSSEHQKAEVMVLIKAIHEMTEEQNFVGDVLVILFSAHIFLLNEDPRMNVPTFELANATIAMVNGLVIDSEVPKITGGSKNEQILDECMVRLTLRVAQPSNKNNHAAFVLNTLWIRTHICKAIDLGAWTDLRRVASLRFMLDKRAAILSFMDPAKFNTLLVTSIEHDLMEICRVFDGDDMVPILPAALNKLEETYTRNRSRIWVEMNGESRELTVLNLIGRLAIGNESEFCKQAIICLVVKHVSFESVNTFQELDTLYSSLKVHHRNHDMITAEIKDSICRSLESRGHLTPSPVDVSSVLQTKIGCLLMDMKGWNNLMNFARANFSKENIFDLLSHMHDLFIGQQEGPRDKAITDELVDAISACIPSPLARRYDFALATFQVARRQRGIFTCHEEESEAICPQLGKLIVSKTELATEIRRNPAKLRDFCSLQLEPNPGVSLIDCLFRELILELTHQCSKIEDAVSFCIRARPVAPSSAFIEHVTSNIMLNSFSNWDPSSISSLLQVNGSTLVQTQTLLGSLPQGTITDGKEEDCCHKGGEYAHAIKSTVLSWFSKYNEDGLDALQLGEVSCVLTKEKREALIKVSGEASFPTKNEVEEKVSAINDMLDYIRSILTVHPKDGTLVSILDLASAYSINTYDDSRFSHLSTKYCCGTDPGMSLADLQRDEIATMDFLQKHGCELQAAAHFLTNKSVLFQHGVGVGTWQGINFEEFSAKISATLDLFGILFSQRANYSDISKAAALAAEGNVCIESELKAVYSFQHISVDEKDFHRLLHSMALAMISEPLQKFVDCCKTHKFVFVTHDDNFSELADICERLVGEEGPGLDVGECYNIGLRIADLLMPDSASLELRHRLKSCLPTLQFFDALRYCGTVFSMAKDRMWFGGEGLKAFYEEYTNVSNVFKSNTSFESEVLDRLEPTMRAISAVGGALGCCSVVNLLEILQDNVDILKLDEMRLVQANITKIQDWFSEGMDDMAAILTKFGLIQTSGTFMLYSETSIESAVPKRALVMRYSRCQTSEDDLVTMTECDMKDFVQLLGFVHQDSDDSTNSVANFIDTHRQLSEILENQRAMADVGFNDNFSSSTLEYALGNSETQSEVAEWLDGSQQKLKQCDDWLRGVRSNYRYSLLFSMDELRYIFQCLSELRDTMSGHGAHVEQKESVDKILDSMSRLSPAVSQIPECSDLIRGHIDEPFIYMSWLEDVSDLVTKCGTFSARLQLPCFQAIEPTCHKKIVIHKVNCYEDRSFGAPLHVLKYIYKSRCPASFEVLNGANAQSPDEIQLFLDRVLAFPDQTFTVISVEELLASNQEIIANYLAKHSRSADGIHLHCIQLSDTILHAPPGVEICSWDDSSLDDDQQLITWLQKYAINQRNIDNITVVCGPSGSGKTHYIRGEMKKLATSKGAEIASLYIHEDFCLAKAVASLGTKFKCGTSQNRVIHVGFSMASAAGNPSKDIMLSVNNFFNSFLILQSIYDTSSGNCFHRGAHSYDLFVEMDSAEDEIVSHNWLRCFVPILMCCNDIIEPPEDYIITDQTRRVCTYLRAYDDRTIDRKFNLTPCNKRIMFVLDNSGSMEIDLGGRSSLEVATDCMLNIFDSHVQLKDHVGLIRFNHEFEEWIPLQQVEDDAQRCRLRTIMHAARNDPCGNTRMFTALSHAVNSLSRNSDADGDAYIICLTDGQSWDSDEHLQHQLQHSPNNLHVILVGVRLDEVYNGVMETLCNKYQEENNPRNKGFFLPTSANTRSIEDAFNIVASRIPVSQTFELDGIMSEVECRAKLEEHRPDFIEPQNKLLYSFWANFLFRRVSVFDQNDDFNYNQEYDSLGSSLMEVMLSESRTMLQRKNNWTSSNHTQLIYDFSQPDNPQFRLICTSPDNLEREQKERLKLLNLPGFNIPTTVDLRKRQILDQYLSQALSIPLNESPEGIKSLQCIDENKFVLTLDFTLKLLNIHERVSCGVPCLMEGETGVSKTALTKMYSILVNSQQHGIALSSTIETLQLIFRELSTRFSAVVLDGNADRGTEVNIRKFLEPSTQHSAKEASRLIYDLIKEACSKRSAMFAPVPPKLVTITEGEGVSELLSWFSESNLEPTFFDINIDPALTADDIKRKIDEVRRVAQKISSLNVKVVVFFDEINTSSVLGLLKEIIVDRSFNGGLLEENIVAIAACNPARQNTASQVKPARELDLGRSWAASGHYQVKKLPNSLEAISWDFGSLDSKQEKEFVHQRIVMMDEPISDIMALGMTEVITSSHELIRTLTQEHIMKSLQKGHMLHSPEVETEAKLRACSVVSLRDIQRVFHLFNFFLCDFSLGSQLTGESSDRFRRAMLLSIGIVYYLRLDALARSDFLQKINSLPSEQYQDCYLEEVLDSTIETLVKHTEIPLGIALTSGLKENVFMTLICTLSRTPLMIIGPPGCSKTLAVSVVTDNANGEESPGLFYRKYARVQPFHYQCSKSSTSNEIAAVFDRAIQRQSKVKRSKQQCLVFMDEAGLPEQEKESLKVLHYLLEGHMSASPEVGFVCITNHPLDAAKSNRCVCLLRPEPDRHELMCIAMGVLCQDSNVQFICFESRMITPEEFCETMCRCYQNMLEDSMGDEEEEGFVNFFGLRDFIHLMKYICRSASLKASVLHISVKIIVHALERNFSGVSNERFGYICTFFLACLVKNRSQIKEGLDHFRRHPMDVLQNSLSERHPVNASRYNLPRYKMIIDNTNDDSVMRLLRMSGILDSSNSFHKLSGMKEGSEMEQLTLVSKIKFAAQQGNKTVVMSQIEEISECFYDLFNQHFKEFKKDGQVLYFANIAIGGISRPCIIHPSFQCIVHVQANQLQEIPAPFLNRFEKFQLNVDDILSWQLSQVPNGIKRILSSVLTKCGELLTSPSLGKDSIWSTSPDETLKSLFISMIPAVVGAQHLKCDGNVYQSQSICSNLVEFLQLWLNLDISIEDIKQSLVTAASELRGIDGIELRKVMETEGDLDQSQLTKSFCDIANGVILDSPLSRSLHWIVTVSITRHVIFQLLQVVKPQDLFLKRDCLPKDILHAYFGGSQEHFNLKSLVSKISKSRFQLYMIHVHSDSCAHSLPSWCDCDGQTMKSSEKIIFESRIRNTVHGNPSRVEIHHLDLLRSESSVRNTINSWASKNEVDNFILVVDMQLQCSSKLVNFIRAHVEQVNLETTKKFLLLLHYPLSCGRPSYPALFLGNWQCAYLDGIGYHGFSSSHLSVNNIFMSACFDEPVLDADSLAGALLPKAVQYVASQVSFYSCSPHPESVNQDMPFTERLIKIEAVLSHHIKGQSLGMLLIKKYLSMWSKEAIREMLHHLAHGLKSGTTHLSLSTAVRNTFQHSFNKFLANLILDINKWSNLDILDEVCSDSETEEIFVLVLSALPGIPLRELLLHRDVYCHLNPLPLELNNSNTLVFFPFYYHVSSFIDTALDKANTCSFENNAWNDLNQDSHSFVTRVDEMLGAFHKSPSSSQHADTSMVEMVGNVIKAVEASPGLFEKYLSHMLLWKFGIRHSSQGVQWILHEMKDMASTTSHCPRNLVLLHVVCRMNVVDIIRMSSWDSIADSTVHLEENSSAEKENFVGIEFVKTMLGHFKSSFTNNSDTLKEWSRSFSIFVISIPNMIGDETQIEEKSMVVALRQLVFLNVIINVPHQAASEMHHHVQARYSMRDFFELFEKYFTGSGGTHFIADAREKLLRLFFSRCWLRSVSDVDQADANFLIDLIKGRQIEHQAAVVLLRNLLLASSNYHHNEALFRLPTKCFTQSVALLICRSLSCQNISDFCIESKRRKRMPHYIPPWLCGDSQPVTKDEIDDSISWYFKNYRNDFNCPLADAVFDIMVGILVDGAKACNSEQLLSLLQQTIDHERSVSSIEQIRRARLAFQPGEQGKLSFVGSCLGAIESDALLLCFVCKTAEELSTSSRALVLCGMYSDLAVHVLGSIMETHKWAELLFSVILRIRGEGHLASLLSEGGALYDFAWCSQFRQGISLLRQDVVADLSEAERNLRIAQRDVTHFDQQYRTCPHCHGLFGIDQTNCGQFRCGRDAHCVNGRPAVGGQMVQETFGCGRLFTLDQSLPYNRSNQHTEDQAALQELSEDYERKKRVFDEFKSGAELRTRATQFDVPPMSFHIQRGCVDDMLPCINLVDFMPEEEDNPGTRLLVSILGHLPRLEQLPYLPDMIELYVFVHKTFRHVVTKDQAMNMQIEKVMDADLLTVRFGSINCAHLQRLWSRVVEGVNAFLNANNAVVNWDCEEVQVPFRDVTDCSLMSMLSEMQHPTEGHDYLFLIINELVLRYNNFIKSISTIASSSNDDQKVEELHPRALVQASKGSIVVNSAVSNTQVVIENVVESYWMKEERKFNVEGLTKAIFHDMGMTGQLQPIKSPLSFLRERFVFRESSVQAGDQKGVTDAVYCSSDGLFFARNEDLSLYEEVKESAKKSGFAQGETNIRHTMIVTFQNLSHDAWTRLLEGLRNVLGHLQESNFFHGEEQFGQAIMSTHVTSSSYLSLGFPVLDNTQLNFLNSIMKCDVMELINVCGEQLSSEAYQFDRISSRLAEPLPKSTVYSVREGITRLLKSKHTTDILAELDAFCEDVLEFYCDRLIVPASESSNEGLSTFLRKNNCCDDSDDIFAAIPRSVTIRNYIDLRKVLNQAKLKLIFDRGEGETYTDALGQHSSLQKETTAQWKWLARPKYQDETTEEFSEKQQSKAWWGLWFEDALLKGGIGSLDPITANEGTINLEKSESNTENEGTINLEKPEEKKNDEYNEESAFMCPPAVDEDVPGTLSENTELTISVETPCVFEEKRTCDKIEEDSTPDCDNSCSLVITSSAFVAALAATVSVVIILVFFTKNTDFTQNLNRYVNDVDSGEDLEEL